MSFKILTKEIQAPGKASNPTVLTNISFSGEDFCLPRSGSNPVMDPKHYGRYCTYCTLIHLPYMLILPAK